ncbi:serine hydrolase [Ligilactobacillus pobuzihii]|uniref:serine hydrolase n=1 Tax=Ligilactobacillus pobuzihii TaxID=449659 RepID=UPI0019D130AB|nr:serine hydrolase [Ligilactobacillus pobuzihii]
MNPTTTRLLHDLADKHIVPGVSYAMLHRGQLQAEVFGEKQIFPIHQKLTAGLLYDVASLTKIVCTTPMILKLIEEQKVTLDQPITELLPRFNDRRVTVRHLLTHTSAITGYIKNRDQLNADELLSAIYEQMYVGDWIGQKVIYTDIGMILLGQIIEKIYHLPVQTVFENEILQPLQLNESGFVPDEKYCVPTTVDPIRGLIQGEVHDPKAFVLGKHCASAGLFMTLNDLIKYAQWMLGQFGKMPILSTVMVESLFADHTPSRTGHRSLGFDLRDTPDGRLCLYHTGYTGTFILLDRQKQDALIVLTNRVHPRQQNAEYLRVREQIVRSYLMEK